MTNSDFTGADFTDADLGSGADFRGSSLAGAKLVRANLPGAQLAGRDLNKANLSEANLSGADLTGAYLPGANLSDANLNGAKLGKANATSANFTGADLTGAELRGANLTWATWADGAQCDWGSIGRCLTGLRSPSVSTIPVDSLTPLLFVPEETGSALQSAPARLTESAPEDLILAARYFLLFEGERPLIVIETKGLTVTVIEGVLPLRGDLSIHRARRLHHQ